MFTGRPFHLTQTDVGDKSSKYLYLLLVPAAWAFFASLRAFSVDKKTKKLPSKGRSVLIIGDSHTGPSNTWTNDFVKAGQFSASAKIAENGKTTAWMLSQLQNYYAKNKAPNYVLIWGGANDAYNGVVPVVTLANMQSMIQLAKSKGSKIVFLSGYDPRKVSFNFNTSGLLGNESTLGQGRERWASFLHSMPKKLKGYDLIVPPHPTFTRSNSTDGLHLTMAAYKQYGNWVANNYFGE